MAEGCHEKDCTVGTTGICLLNNDPKTCPQRVATDIVADPDAQSDLAGLTKPAQNPTFPASLALSIADAGKLMAGRYCQLIGILGPPDAGKTAMLVCIYLLVAAGKLPGYAFRNSDSLIALEEISRGARRWKAGDPPGSLTQHTEAKDERAAGFLHFRLVRGDDEQADFLFPDLPGEWTTALIDHNRSDRLDFLRTTDAIWIMLDGLELTTRAKRQTALHRIGLLLQRVHALFADSLPPVRLVLSRRDKGELPAETYQPLITEAAKLGIPLTVSQIASFSEDDGIEPGAGIPELLATVFAADAQPIPLWPDAGDAGDARQMLRYRKR
jgi:hypothetical protein